MSNLPTVYKPQLPDVVGGSDGTLFFDFWREVASRARTAWDTGSLAQAVKADFGKYPLTSLPGAAAEGVGAAYAKTVDQSGITKTAPGPGNPNAPRRLAQAAKAAGSANSGQSERKGSVIEETSLPKPTPAPDSQLPESPAGRKGGSLRSRQTARSVQFKQGVKTPAAEANVYERAPRRSRRKR